MKLTVIEIRNIIRGLKPDREIEFTDKSFFIMPSVRKPTKHKDRKINYQKVHELHRQGKGPTEIGNLLGVSKQHINYILKGNKK